MFKTNGKLIICPTPLGNLGDMTLRAKAALEGCDAVCCEDTRVTGKLLTALGISKRLERLDEASIAAKAEGIIERVLAGEVICYCSDAGMPGVSDPGQRLIAKAYEDGAPVEVLPGGTAAATAYVASGFTTKNFYFGSFFPRKQNERVNELESLRSLDAALIFYESPQRLASALQTISEVLPLRMVAVCRELTKIHEEVVRGLAGEVAQVFSEREAHAPIKGEIVIVIDAACKEEHDQRSAQNAHDALTEAQELIAAGKLTKKEIVKSLQRQFDLSRNDAYALVLSISKDD